MNCKPGDLAYVIKSNAGNEGRVVRCVRLHDSEHRDLDGISVVPRGPRWVIDPPLKSTIPHLIYSMPDVWLRPIRPQPDDAVDEVIQRIGTPHKEVA